MATLHCARLLIGARSQSPAADACGQTAYPHPTITRTREAIFLFMVSTFKTVDDQCGYSLPFDPL
ncbi:hypothetical protein OH77DRAFT_1427073 [Trametes cingulata]|nr:hypothetical protein OH77DRAFT_1427073 [Trametes cingulata]